MRKEVVSNDMLKSKVMEIELPPPPTKFLNRDAIISMVHFGKGILEKKDKVKVNSILDPIIVKYYKKGAWDVY
jgi:spermidine synthase